MKQTDNFYIFEFKITNRIWEYAIELQEKLSDSKYSELNEKEQKAFLENAVHRITIDFFFNFNQLPNSNLYTYIPTFYYEVSSLDFENAILKLWYFRDCRAVNNYNYSVKNIDFDWKSKKTCSESLVKINKDISRYLGNGSYYIQDSDLVGDFKLEHFSNVNVEYLNYDGIIDLENYPFFNLIDWSKIKRHHKRFIFEFMVPGGHKFRHLVGRRIKLVLTIKSQFKTRHRLQDYQVIEDLAIHNFKSINEIIYFKKDVLNFTELAKYFREKAVSLVEEFNENNAVIIPDELIKYVKKGFKRHAKFLKSNFYSNNLRELISGEYLENDFYYFSNMKNAYYYVLINYFYTTNQAQFPISNNLFDQGLLLFQYVKNVNLLDPKTSSILLAKHEYYSKTLEILNFFASENNEEIYKKLFLSAKILKI
ncbi:Uncharacterised protein [Mycoplasmopsis californica]|uniref:Uncharacterized protein n=1 Tax=Mycoplasmopsis equigenitalium TaxID=114883 RepID=A0ABY5J0I3_9BACT|nr:hypothetical protein [Mycoplasmopsis equigenitalium]UUD36770.1 hypothetical protein NPA09_02630 [Mycoplasmopsis equigenitalium]VEU69932.1 Uncharacterised protein [Mycoplasmopsis californica]